MNQTGSLKRGCDQAGLVKVVVNFLPPAFSQKALGNLMQTTSGYQRCNVVRDKNTGLSQGYAFAYYTSERTALEACTGLSGIRIGHKILQVTLARPRTEEYQHTKLFVIGIPLDWYDMNLQEYFATYGNVISAKIVRNNQTGLSTGSGFIIFERHEYAEEAFITHQLSTSIFQVFKNPSGLLWTHTIEPKPLETSLLIKGTGPFSNLENMEDYFAQIGKIQARHYIRSNSRERGVVPDVLILQFTTPYTARLAGSLAKFLALDVQYPS